MSTVFPGGRAVSSRANRTARLALKVGASALALLATPALADCVPNTTYYGTYVVCTGNDPDGIIVSAIYASVIVTLGANVDSIVATNYPNPYNPSGSALIDVAGTVTNGLVIDSGTSAQPFNPPTEDVALTVAATGRINGAAPILLRTQPGSFFARATATIVNNGEIRTTVGAGPAIVALGSGARIYSLTNSSTGSIVGGIQADIGAIDNQGLIDGLSNSAIAPGGEFTPAWQGRFAGP